MSGVRVSPYHKLMHMHKSCFNWDIGETKSG